MKWLCRFIAVFVVPGLIFGCGGGGGSDSSGDDAPAATTFSLDRVYLQHRNYEAPVPNSNCSWVSIVNSGSPAMQSELNDMGLFSASGAEQVPTHSEFSTYRYLFYDCSSSPCSSPVEQTQSGFFQTYNSLANDNYLVNVSTTDGDDLEETISFPGEISVPTVSSTTMTSHWVEGALVLSWSNPSTEANWSEVDTLRIVIHDAENTPVLYTAVQPTTETVTIPATVVAEAAAVGEGSITTWGIQTRAVDGQGMNYARGYSINQKILQNEFSYIQYRSFENPAFNAVYSYVTVNQGADPAEEVDLAGLNIFNTVPTEVFSASTSFDSYNFLVYDCRNSTCLDPREVTEAGYFSRYDPLAADTYSLVVSSLEGSTATSVVPYAGAVTLPVITQASMGDNLTGGDLQLSWSNPTGEPQWDEVDQLRVVLYDGTGEMVLMSILETSDETITLPEAVVDQAAALGDGAIYSWRLQARAYDSFGFNYARSISTPKIID